MHIDVNLRANAARTLLDVVSSMTVEDSGTADADARALLALEALGLPPLENDPHLAATLAAATDLIWALTISLAQWRHEPPETTIFTVREQVLPAVYPDAAP